MRKYESLDTGYLIKQNRKLRGELQECMRLNMIHKQVLAKVQTDVKGSDLVSGLLKELTRVGNSHTLQELREELFRAQGEILVLQKIVDQTYQNEKDTYLMLVEQFHQMQSEKERCESQLNNFYEKIGEVDYLSGLVTKYREVISPTEGALAFKKEQDQLLDVISLQQKIIKKLTDEKERLIKINIHMKEEVERRKDEVKNMTMMLPNQDQDSTYDPKNYSLAQSAQLNTTLGFMKLQRELIKQVDSEGINQSDSDEEMDCPQLAVLFPDKVIQIRSNRQQAKIPYLNMKKVRELMVRRQQKLQKDFQAENHHVNPTTKIIQLEEQLDITRKQNTSTLLKMKTLSEELKNANAHIEELENRNILLAKANQEINSKYRTMHQDYSLCRSVVNQVEKVLGRKITDQKNMLEIRQEMTTLMLQENNSKQFQQDKIANALRKIFKEKGIRSRKRTYSQW